jgi:HlyD family secretion protein
LGTKATSPKPPSNRAERTAERREAIIEAALDEFISRGFTATRIDDVARRAGVAKGTIYLHFKDKESMFEELIRTALVPLIGRLHAPPPIGGSVRDAVEAFARTFIQEVASTRRGDIVRLIVAEGPRFPSIADFYYREVVSRGLAGMRALIELAVSRGEIQQKNLARFPQILVAPAIIAVIWQSLFSRHAPLDATEMFRVHLDLRLRILAALALAAVLAGCNQRKDPGYQGWVEADMIFVSPDESGRVIRLDVREGDEVKQGAPLYSVDDDLQKADLNQNNATLANAQQTYDRAASLNKTGSGTQANLDSAVSALRVAEARVNTSQTRLTRRSGFAPVSGTIQQIYFREGEMVPAQRPVLSIMPPGNMKVRFYVPEPDLPKLAVGDEVRVTCDNCAGDLTAKIYFIATMAEYTPPVIYSLDERNKLVYLVQARPSRPDSLRVGQPISVFLGAKTPVADKR